MKGRNNNVPFASRKELVLCVALACLNIALYGIVVQLFEVELFVLAVAFVCLYLAEVSVIGVMRKINRDVMDEGAIYTLLEEKGSVILKNTVKPTCVFNEEGALLWCNVAMHDVLKGEENPIGRSFDSIFGSAFDKDTVGKEIIILNDRLYKTESFIIEEDDKNIHVVILDDTTDFLLAEEKFNDNIVCIAYIAIDNIEDVLQYVQEKFRIAVSKVDEQLKAWAESMNASIKSYDNDKYIMFFDAKSLKKCVENRFSILDDIRETRVGDGVSVTVSIGVSKLNGSLLERDIAARDAIDLALQRGGDQVVYNDEGVTYFFGGKTKSVYKRSNVRSRTFTNQLMALMSRADNVLIMGHRFGDFDSFGASIGVARIAMLCGVKVNIAVDLRDKNLEPCIAMLQEDESYSRVFVDNADGLDLVGADTLLVLVDHNSPARAQFADISAKVRDIVIIDHHRKHDAFGEQVKLYYIEPSASSACELVTEMLESAVSSQNLVKEAADMLLAGILLDTKQFTRNTGTRTFGSAQYLRGAGADPSDVYGLFKTSPDDLRKESRFHSVITIYRNNIAIASCDGETDDSYRIIASKAADKMLTLRDIDAAFALVRIGEQIHISGRSNGKVNVQLILERLNGGGHFDVAGAQVDEESITSVLETLKSSIDDYLDEK